MNDFPEILQWKKLGLVYRPSGKDDWRCHTAMVPTPFCYNDERIRIFAGFRDPKGISRVGYADVEAQNPLNVLQISEQPVLDIGQEGCFDDNGLFPTEVLRVGNEVWMYYVGFQLVEKVKFLAFTGLAISQDGGDTFKRVSQCPVMDRSDEGLYIRAIHAVLLEDGIFKVYYSVGSSWEIIDGKPFPRYEVYFSESKDGIHFPEKGIPILAPDQNKGEYRLGRSKVYRLSKDKYMMFFTYGNRKGDYLPGYAESNDGLHWTRIDRKINLPLSEKGWDSIHLCYPSLIQAKEKVYIFYNGNYFGQDGFGCAKLIASGEKE